MIMTTTAMTLIPDNDNDYDNDNDDESFVCS